MVDGRVLLEPGFLSRTISRKMGDQTINKPGNIGVFQVKYSIPVGSSGVQIPISFTASNRTELVNEKDVRGNIGITFDQLLAKKSTLGVAFDGGQFELPS